MHKFDQYKREFTKFFNPSIYQTRIEQTVDKIKEADQVFFIGNGGSHSIALHMAEDLLKTKGIVIWDEQGNERILIGSPIPYAKNRIRTDSIRAKENWAFMHPEYMNFYKGYNHSANGILILDENGYDRIVIGSQTPDPNIGPRIAPASGLILNDEMGFERSGYAILKVNGKDRVNLGMDTNKGTEGLILTVDDRGVTGLSVRSQKQNICLGKADSTKWDSKNDFPFNGLLIEQADSTEFRWNTYNRKN